MQSPSVAICFHFSFGALLMPSFAKDYLAITKGSMLLRTVYVCKSVPNEYSMMYCPSLIYNSRSFPADLLWVKFSGSPFTSFANGTRLRSYQSRVTLPMRKPQIAIRVLKEALDDDRRALVNGAFTKGTPSMTG